MEIAVADMAEIAWFHNRTNIPVASFPVFLPLPLLPSLPQPPPLLFRQLLMRCLWDSRIQAQGSLALGRYLGGGERGKERRRSKEGRGERRSGGRRGRKKREDKRETWEKRKDEERWGERRSEEYLINLIPSLRLRNREKEEMCTWYGWDGPFSEDKVTIICCVRAFWCSFLFLDLVPCTEQTTLLGGIM